MYGWSRLPRTLLAAVLVTTCAAAAAGAAARPLTIVADERIGSFRVKADGTLGGAVAAFGAPTRLNRTSDSSCDAIWRPLNLMISFYNLGGSDACSREFGKFGRAIARAGARTTKGLRVGDPVSRLRRLYPKARYHAGLRGFRPGGYWLVPRSERFNPGTYPGLLAETSRGRVVSLQVRYQAGGD